MSDELHLLDPDTMLAVRTTILLADLPGYGGEAIMTPTQIAELCRRLDIVKIAFSFSGGSDEGGPTDCVLTHADDSTSDVALYNTPAPLNEITAVIDAMLYDHWYHFDGEPSVDGTGTFDVATATWTLEGSESVSDYEEFTYTYTGDEVPTE